MATCFLDDEGGTVELTGAEREPAAGHGRELHVEVADERVAEVAAVELQLERGAKFEVLFFFLN